MTATPPPSPRPARAEGKDRSILKSGTGLIGVKLANAVLGFATITLFARLMAPDTYGVYLLALTVAQFLSLPLQMGLPVLLNREIAIATAQDNPGLIRGLQSWTRRIVTWGTLILGTLLIAAYALCRWLELPVLRTFDWPMMLLIVALIPVLGEIQRTMGTLSGFRRVAQSRVPDGIVRPALLLGLGVLGLAMLDFSATALLATYLVAALVAMVAGHAMIRRVLPEAVRHGTVVPELQTRDWWRSLGPLSLFAAAGSINTYADALMLGALTTPQTVAYYRIAVQLATTAMLIQVTINAILGPRVAALHATGDTARIQRMAVIGSRLAFGIVFAFALVLALIGRDGFMFLFGPDYGPVYGMAVLLAFGQAGTAAFGGTILVLNMTRRESFTARYAIWTTLGNIVLNLILIPTIGAMGAIIATIATNMTMQMLSWNRLRRDVGIRSDALASARRS